MCGASEQPHSGRTWFRWAHSHGILAASLYALLLQALSGFPNTTAHPSSRVAINRIGGVMFSIPETLQNVAHLPLYAGLGFLWFSALAERRGARGAFWLSVLLSCVLGLLNEGSQLFMVSRHFSLLDAFANVVGACCGAMAARHWWRASRLGIR